MYGADASYPGCASSMLANVVQQKPDLAVVLADGPSIGCIKFMANTAVVYSKPKAYHFCMTQYACPPELSCFASHCNERNASPTN